MNKKYRKAIIAGNWKMNMLSGEAKSFVDELRSLLPGRTDCEIVVCAPFPLLPALAEYGEAAGLAAGAQDLSQHKNGAYTGEVSAEQIRDVGAMYAIAGHSERRLYHDETDAAVAAKAMAALEAGLTPIICVGESLEQREKDLTMELVAYQVKAALCGVPAASISRCVIAYEPVWAIGTGKTATAEQADEVCRHIRQVLREKYGETSASGVSILYGGSMNAKNAAELLAMPDIDGGLVGGASLKPADFSQIILAASEN